MLIAVDAGRAFVKTVTGNQKFSFPSKVSKARKRTFVQTLEEDIELRYQGKEYFIGQLAEREGSFTRQMMTESKVNVETVLLILTALFKAGAIGDVKLVTGVPINMYKEEERDIVFCCSLLFVFFYFSVLMIATDSICSF